MELGLIGLDKVWVAAVRALAGTDARFVREVAGLKELRRGASSFDLVVLSSVMWRDYVALPEPRPPAYVVCPDEKLDYLLMDDLYREGALGYCPADPDLAASEVVATWRTLRRPDEAEGLRVGTLLVRDPEGERQRGAALVGWGIGPTSEARLDIEEARMRLGSLQPIEDWPFDVASPTAWLELYAYEKFGAGITETEAESLFEKIPGRRKIQQRSQILDEFGRHFLEASRSSARPFPILLEGETGTGKTVVTRMLHKALELSAGGKPLPFHHVNCSSLGEMADVELFGGMRGAYTSLDLTNPGKVLASYGGTLFLDEFGSLPLTSQGKLLLLLENGQVTPMAWLGDPLYVPVQVIAATNERLVEKVAGGGFRADLYYRFRSGTISLPPLRDVKETDLRHLVDYILQDHSINRGEKGQRGVDCVSKDAMEKLAAHLYPGNFRELQKVLGAAVERAQRARRGMLCSTDVRFEPSTLPRQDVVVAVILRDVGGRRQILLRWNPHWHQHFLLTERVEAETYETALVRLLGDKLGLERSEYKAQVIPLGSDFPVIQHSGRDQQLKHYHFHCYRVEVAKEKLESLSEADGLRWEDLGQLLREGDLEKRGISRSILLFDSMLEKLTAGRLG